MDENGNTENGVAFPLDSFREAAIHLRRPFTVAAVKFKVQATWPKAEPNGGLIVSYIDARLVVERLNLLVPHLWEDSYEPIGNRLMWCHLTVDGITRKDVGEGEGKGLVSDALKRAAVKFGIGVSLYATPKMILNKGDHLKPKQSRQGPTLELTPNGEANVRNLYARWLDTHGIKAFGQPLDHGDVEGAQGDIEADDPSAESGVGEASSTPAATAQPVEPTERLASAKQRSLIFAKAGEDHMPSSVLANVVLVASGSEPREFASDQDAEQWLKRSMDRLPARLVDPILQHIAAEVTPA